MKIIVISDTHMPNTVSKLPDEIGKILSSADMVLHAGDFASRAAYEEIKNLCNLKAVRGNMDETLLAGILPEYEVIEIAGKRIGLLHGKGSPDHTIQYAWNTFHDKSVDVVVFGHTHRPFNQKKEGILMFNPGSLLDKRFHSHCSYGVLTIDEKGKISAEIIHINSQK